MSDAVDRKEERKTRLYEEGFRLFNSGDHFAAHEKWEEVWLSIPRGHPNHLFLQGLIQVAGALDRSRRGSPLGASRLFRSARRKLIPFAPAYKGLDIASLLPLLARMQPALKIEPGGRGWAEPDLPCAPSDIPLFRAFEQYSSGRQVTAPCPKCSEILTVEGHRRAPAAEDRSSWRVWCPRACVSRAFGEARA